jgi:hypothetical protein
MRFFLDKPPMRVYQKWYAWYPVVVFQEPGDVKQGYVWLEYVVREKNRGRITWFYTFPEHKNLLDNIAMV